MHGVRFLSLLLILVVVNSFVNGGEASLNPIAVAAERTESAPGARFTMKASYTGAGLAQPVVAHGKGARNSQTGRSRAVMSVEVPQAPTEIHVESIGDGTSIYMRSSTLGSKLPEGKEWMRVEPFLGHSESEAVLGGSDADSSLQMLGSTGDVERVGTEQVRGTSTTRYRAVVDLDNYADALRGEDKDELADLYEKYSELAPDPAEVEVWVDSHKILRRLRMVMEIPTRPGGPTLTMDMRMDFFDFGARPRIELPDPASVYDATPTLERELDAAG
ncbi:MAG TPA: hypothetical protein VKA35_03910 [Solirubrobacterales bacterium]|nr:hypothetical protein [Solirubrobacterales bacterium]